MASLVGALAALMLGLAQPSPSSTQLVQAWLDQVWELASASTDDRGLRVRWRERAVYVPSSERLAEIKARIIGHPQHPERAKLAEYESILAGRPPTAELTLWIVGDEWRCNLDPIEPPRPYWDRTVRRQHSWSLSEDTLVRIDPRRDVPAGYEYSSETSGLRGKALAFATGGLSALPIRGVSAPRIVPSGDVWHAEAETEGGRVNVQGHRGTAASPPGITQVRFTNQHGQVTVYTSDGWRESPVLQSGVAERVRVHNDWEPGTTDLLLLELDRCEVAELHRVTRMPPVEGDDAVRGRTTFRSVQDFSGSVPMQSRVSEEQGAGRSEEAQSVQQGYESYARLRVLGWVVAVSLLVLLIALRVQRRSGA